MTELSFRGATLDEVDAVVALVESAYRGESSRAGWTTEADLLDGQRTDRAAVQEIVELPDRDVLLAISADGQMLGCCEVRRLPHRVGYFGMFAVVPTLQGAGVGGQLLAAAERHALDHWNVAVMEMTVIGLRRDLIAWYERRGYSLTGESRPFPHADERFGLPRRSDLEFVVLTRSLA
jgi:GNAT superfamily N-acetyltransferase